ncbi:hypothetical protein ACFP81_05550 [Deinococcus lacus]|uniref:VCBS repeat-containing protein n=1 Tax=Deinococcus lacus TaxID=392561 RepID=A0ABW1YDM9_9DEIO
MRRLLSLLLCTQLLGTPALALTPAEVADWPVIYQAGPGENQPPLPTFTAAERTLLRQIADGANARPAMKQLRQAQANLGIRPLGVDDVLFSMVAPYRSAQSERLTVFRVLEAEPPMLLAVLSGGRVSSGWLVEPRGNMLICSTQQGYTLRDINADGRREVAWVYGCGDGPSARSAVALLDWSGASCGSWAKWNLSIAALTMKTPSSPLAAWPPSMSVKGSSRAWSVWSRN